MPNLAEKSKQLQELLNSEFDCLIAVGYNQTELVVYVENPIDIPDMYDLVPVKVVVTGKPHPADEN